MAIPTLKQLLEAGVHFGHQTRRWDPRMKPYIFTERNGIHIIDLQQTMKSIKVVFNFVKDLAADGKGVLFVGTKKQATTAIANEASKCQMYYINQRWMGGTLTNFQTIKKSIHRLLTWEGQRDNGDLKLFPKKEQIYIDKQIVKLNRSLGGIKKMKGLPGAVFIIDPRRETIAIMEARKLNIPVIALADTNCDPTFIDYVIPGNDDAIRAIGLVTQVISDAVDMGRAIAKAKSESAPEVIFDEETPFTPSDEDLDAFSTFEESYEEEEEKEVRSKVAQARKDEATGEAAKEEETAENVEEKPAAVQIADVNPAVIQAESAPAQ
ncbi:MAG: 30S ribosomal protein S2 [Candidatus Lindowbacteria bacterium]|nr:30S ribosomal protein S2 [Candidatus Lindowbacteria bacterium]